MYLSLKLIATDDFTNKFKDFALNTYIQDDQKILLPQHTTEIQLASLLKEKKAIIDKF